MQYDPYYIPTAPGGISGPNCPIPGAYFCFLNARDQQRFAMALMHVPGQPGYRLVQGRTVDETKALAVSLGLTEAHVDEKTNRIGWGGVDVLAMLPLDEYRRRMEAKSKRAADRQEQFKQDHPARIDGLHLRGVKGVVMQRGEYEERAAHAARPGQPVVGYEPPPAEPPTQAAQPPAPPPAAAPASTE